jgi:hypothetical protein
VLFSFEHTLLTNNLDAFALHYLPAVTELKIRCLSFPLPAPQINKNSLLKVYRQVCEKVF